MSAEWDCQYCGHSNLRSFCPCGRPNESDELKAELSHLQKLCEKQKGEIERLKAWPLLTRIDKDGNSETHPIDRVVGLQDIEIASLKSQLATQTERARKLTEALKVIASGDCIDCYADKRAQQALNQESLGKVKQSCEVGPTYSIDVSPLCVCPLETKRDGDTVEIMIRHISGCKRLESLGDGGKGE